MLHCTLQRSSVYEQPAYVPQVHLSASAETTYLSKCVCVCVCVCVCARACCFMGFLRKMLDVVIFLDVTFLGIHSKMFLQSYTSTLCAKTQYHPHALPISFLLR